MKKILEQFVNLLFPKFCVGCRVQGVWLCQSCVERLHGRMRKITHCPWCNRIPTVCGFLCQECRTQTHITQLISAYDYRDDLVERLVIQLKYARVEELAALMGAELSAVWARDGRRDPGSIVVPIPLHTRRLRERGFNQAERIARVFAKSHDMVCAPHVLVRTQYTSPQVELSKEEREKNVHGAFAAKDVKALRGNTVILVDDVCTTGATLRAAAEILMHAGVKKVIALTFAHG